MSAPATTGYTHDANGNLLSATGGKYRSIAYTSFNLPDSQSGAQGPSGTPKYTWLYDESHARIKEVHVDAGGTRTTWYQHPDNQGSLAFESETAPGGALSQRHYLSAAGQTIGVLVSSAALPVLGTGQTAPPAIASIALAKVEYWHKDQLGSLITTTDHTGAVTARYAWDPFGKRRLTNGTRDAAGSLVIDWKPTLNWGTDRGFTGHEQLDDIGLVHMNGRIYDAALGRFLQADPNLQDPGDLQSFNRYAYCYGNPLNCTDPSGQTFFLTSAWKHFWHNSDMRLVASIAVGFALGPGGGALLQSLIADAVAQTAVAGFVSGAVASGTFKGAVQGSFTALVFYGTGQAFGEITLSNGTVDPELLGQAVAAHAVAGRVSSVAGEGKCGPGALSAAFSKLATPITGELNPVLGTVASAVIGGTAAELGGGKFANGAVTGAFGYLFNECAHTRMCGSDSTSVRVTGNRVVDDLAHVEIEISSGYDFVVLEARPGSTGRLVDTSNGPNWGSAFSYELVPPGGETAASIGLRLQAAAKLYGNDL